MLEAAFNRSIGLYSIENTVNGKRYIGSSFRIPTRLKEHRAHLVRGAHHSHRLQKDWDKYGEDSFNFKLLVVCRMDDRLFYEQQALIGLKPEYNINPVVFGPSDWKRGEEFRAKCRARKGTYSAEQRAAQSARAKAHKPTDRQLAALAAGRLLPRSPEAIKKTADAQRGIKRSEETKRKLSLAHKGKPCLIAELKKAITHCPKGHAYTPDNLYTSPSTHGRRCLRCIKDGLEEGKRLRNFDWGRVDRECPQGHPRSAENYGFNPKTGAKWCRVCNRERNRKGWTGWASA